MTLVIAVFPVALMPEVDVSFVKVLDSAGPAGVIVTALGLMETDDLVWDAVALVRSGGQCQRDGADGSGQRGRG